ncbi:biotin--[acetyl-CoA-carboxylase] ligase [Sphingobium sp. BS19]|nr:biotin--[acetyl-CoA-carboxylase] ligase [Sphingobium sp. BS19]
MVADGATEGLWLRAEMQAGGRGRLDRVWESPPGNLYCSTLIRLQPGDPPPPTLALVAGVAVWQAVEMVLPGKARIKWPNDILVGPAKLSGMLLERTGNAVVLGIGLNIMAPPVLPDRATTSLWAHGAVDTDATSMLSTLAEIFAARLSQWRTYGLDPIRTLWLKAAHASGTAIRAHLPDGTELSGHFADLDASGALILDLADGTRRTIHAGDIFLL